MVATIHNEVRDRSIKRISYGVDNMIEESFKTVKSFFDGSIDSMKYLQKINRIVANKLGETDYLNIRKGIVHLDIWYDNMAIANNNDITIFDFDFCGNGLLITDVAYFLNQLYHIEPDKNRYEELRKEFLEGYGKRAEITSGELELVPFLGWSAFMFYLGIQVKRLDWSNVFLSENYLDMYVGRMKSWIDYHGDNVKV